ncbi:MAG: NADH-quinone oxidoreductase subunit B [Actinomycetota bacterium]|nr:NADH-quinone oxidoreductase subunit B [Actinomycetota bacterium]
MFTTTLEKGLNWARANSCFPATFGLACCAIEFMSMVSARPDIARFGAEALRASPRQADLLVLSGRVSIKMAPVVRRLYDQMLEPKWVISMGACSSSGGMFANYAVVQGADKFMPVDIHVPGCPPRPEAVLNGFIKLQRKIEGSPDLGWRQRYKAIGTEEWARLEPGKPTREAVEAAARAIDGVPALEEMDVPTQEGAPNA